MTDNLARFSVKIAHHEQELREAQRLRYQVFVEELGGGGVLVDHEAKLECDSFDPYFEHMVVRDEAEGRIVGVYRLMREEQALQAGRFYSESEYDLTRLRSSGRKLLELGRSCIHPDYRGGAAMHCLWSGLAEYVAKHDIEILFGVASFHGTDVGKLSNTLSILHHRHLAPETLRVRSKILQNMNLIPYDQLNRKQAMLETPALIKAYLRLGGCVGEGAYIDHDFNTTDVFLILDTAQMTDRQSRRYTQPGGGLS